MDFIAKQSTGNMDNISFREQNDTTVHYCMQECTSFKFTGGGTSVP